MTDNERPVFIGCITHDNKIDFSTATKLLNGASESRTCMTVIHQSSLLAKNCNELWAQAQNLRSKHNFKWFAMVHSDVIPEEHWLDKLIELAEASDADLLSVALPIKDERGLSSTAVSHWFDTHSVCARITQHQLRKLPEVFDITSVKEVYLKDDLSNPGQYLLANTGLMVVRMDLPFSDQLYFTINDDIRKNADTGKLEVFVEPEDWFFSRRMAELGGKVKVTTAVQAHHIGTMKYNNKAVWGLQKDA